jgi:hypothetical protein
MFITDSTLNIILEVYLLLLVSFSLIVLRNKKYNAGNKLLKLLLLYFIPVIGMVILTVDYLLNLKEK